MVQSNAQVHPGEYQQFLRFDLGRHAGLNLVESANATHAEDRYWDCIDTQYFVLTTQSGLDSVIAQVDIVIQCLHRLGNKDKPASEPRER